MNRLVAMMASCYSATLKFTEHFSVIPYFTNGAGQYAKLTLSVSVLESRPTHILSVVSQGETFSLPLLFEQQQKTSHSRMLVLDIEICLNIHCPAFMCGGKTLSLFKAHCFHLN